MNNPQNSQVNVLLIILSMLAIGGGLVIVLITSPQSLQLSRYNFLPARATDPATATASPTATDTPLPASATLASSSTPFIPTATATAAPPTPGPINSPTPTLSVDQLTDVALPADVRGLAVVVPLSNSQTARVRDLPNGDTLVAAVAGGTRLQVLFGEAVIDGVEWLEVRLDNLQTGWIARSLITFTYERPPATAGPASTAENTPTP
jgi:cytoskeletal protein RodZ